MENIIFAGAGGACANIQINGSLSGQDLAALKESSGYIIDADLYKLA